MAASQDTKNPKRHARRYRSVGFFSQILLIFIFAAAAGAVFALKDLTLASVLRGSGKVAFVGKIRRVLSPIDGVLAARALREGAAVEADQVMFLIESKESTDATAPAASLPALRSIVLRLEAEANGKKELILPEDLAENPEALSELAVFSSRKTQLAAALRGLRNAAAKTKLDIAEQKAAANRHARARDLAQEELDVLKPLVTRGISPKLEYLRVQQKVQDLEAQRQAALLAVPRLEGSLRESEGRLEETVTSFQDQAQRELVQKQSELSVAEQEASKRSTVREIEVQAPIRGTIRRVFVRNAGEQVRAGQSLVEITPIAETLFVDARFPSTESMGLEVGQVATLSTNAPGRTNIPAVVAKVDPGTVTDTNGRHFTNARFRVDADAPGFDVLSKTSDAVVVTIESDSALIDYLWDTIIGARGGPFQWP